LKLEPKSKNAHEALKRLKKAEELRPRVAS